MECRLLGRTGVKVSPLALGTDNFISATPEDECEKILNAAMDAGIHLLDTADVYAGEEAIGRILKKNGRRHEMLILTKVDHTGQQPQHPDAKGRANWSAEPPSALNEHGHSRLNIIRTCEASLKRLQTDYIDVYQPHRPSRDDIPVDETLGALNDLVRQGKGMLDPPGVDGHGSDHGERIEGVGAVGCRAAAVQPARSSHRERAYPNVPEVGPRADPLGANGPGGARRPLYVGHRLPRGVSGSPARRNIRRSGYHARHRGSYRPGG